MSIRSEPRDGPVPPELRLQYLVVLAGTDPLVWRRVRIPATYSFWDFHVAIQDSMGWTDSHLHEFRVPDPRSGTIMRLGFSDPDLATDRTVTAEWTEFPLDFSRGYRAPMQYIYDFGDNWEHAVVFEGFEQVSSNEEGPVCVGGAGACPPEDCGGTIGYTNLLMALADPHHPEHKDLLDWVGGPIDPASFSAQDVRFEDPKERWESTFGGGAA